MRVRALLAILVLLLPAASSAQRLPMPGTGRARPRPADLPPQPPAVARALAYRRLPLSVESYPLLSRIETSGFTGDGMAPSWTSFGMGTRADYRITRYLSATMDVTSSFVGGPVVMETAEIGTRLRPERNDRRVYPFLDARVGYSYAQHRFFQAFDPFASPASLAHGGRYSSGFGALGGAGMEVALTTRFSLTTAASVMHSRMTAYGFEGTRPTRDTYRMISYRYTLGIRYNPVRLIRPPGTDLP
jgi:hypothetical protein